MKNLKTNYMGIELDNPIIIGASNISNSPDTLKMAEESGAAAIVYKSLFEEQIQLERFKMDEELHEYDEIHAEMRTMHPSIQHAGPTEHLANLRKAKESINIPLIASLNAINDKTWTKYAGLIGETGVDAIELNFYRSPTDFSRDAKEIEDEQVEILKKVKQNLSIPVSVKLSAEYTNILNIVNRMDEAGADAFVLFNAFFMPDIDVNNKKHIKLFSLSNKGDYKKSLRYTGILYNNIKADICSSHGIHNGNDALRLLLSGALCVQVVSTVYKYGFTQIDEIKSRIVEWMFDNGYSSLDEFRGELSKNNIKSDPLIYKRAQYADLLINSEEIFKPPKYK